MDDNQVEKQLDDTLLALDGDVNIQTAVDPNLGKHTSTPHKCDFLGETS